MKKYLIIGVCVLAAIAIAWGIFQPARMIETSKIVKVEDTEKLKKTQSQLTAAINSKSVLEKKLAQISELAKNINIEREFYPDGKLKFERIIDLSKYVKKSDSESTATSTATVTITAAVDETIWERIKKKETDESKTVTNPIPLWESQVNYITVPALQFEQGLNIFDKGMLKAILQKNLLDAGFYYGGGISFKY